MDHSLWFISWVPELSSNKEKLKEQKSELKAQLDSEFETEKNKVIAQSTLHRSHNAQNFESTTSKAKFDYDVGIQWPLEVTRV